MQKPATYTWSELPPEQLNPLLTRQFLPLRLRGHARPARPLQRLRRPTHAHPNEQIAYVLEGALEFNVGGELHTVRSGEVLVIPRDVPHSALALEDTIGLDIFAPPGTTGSTVPTAISAETYLR